MVNQMFYYTNEIFRKINNSFVLSKVYVIFNAGRVKINKENTLENRNIAHNSLPNIGCIYYYSRD